MSVVARTLRRGAKFGLAGAGALGGVAVSQAVYLRWTYDSPDDPSGARHGIAGQRFKGKPLNILFVGDSVAIGVGAMRAAPIQAAFAEKLARLREVPVRWHTVGGTGLDTRELKAMVAGTCQGQVFDSAIVLCGVNDGKKLLEGRFPSVFRRDLGSLCAEVRRRVPEGQISIPRIPGYMVAPQLQLWPMRHFIRFAFEPYDEQKLVVASEAGMESPSPRLEDMPGEEDRHLWASDGMHPSGEGYRVLGEWLASSVFEGLSKQGAAKAC